MTPNEIQNAISGLEQIEQTLHRLLEYTHDTEVKQELKNLRHTILRLNQEMILEKRKEDRRLDGDRRSLDGDRREGLRRSSTLSRRKVLI